MGTFASTRRGRPRKAVLNDEANGQGEIKPTVDSGNGQVSSDGKEPPAKDSGSSERIGWLGLVEAVKAEQRIVATAWHREAESEVISTNASDVRVLEGDPAYQLSSGEIITM